MILEGVSYRVVCDGCGEWLSSLFDDESEASLEAELDGATLVGDRHYCEPCWKELYEIEDAI